MPKDPSDSFVARHGLWTEAQEEAARRAEAIVAERRLEVVRFAFADQHGVLRGKTVTAAEFSATLRNGCGFTTTLLGKDTSHRTVFPVFTKGGGYGMAEMQGGGDALMIADPTTFRVLPWVDATGWVLCDIHFGDGRPVPFSTRWLYRTMLDRLAERGFSYMAGLEVEFHLFKLEDPRLGLDDAGQPGTPPTVSGTTLGYNYLTEQRYDMVEPVLEVLRRHLVALDLPLRSIEIEFGPSQIELTFSAGIGMDPADQMVLFRSATKQICRRLGYHATFMCRPGLPKVFSSGWHLHQSLRRLADGGNAFVAAPGSEAPLSAEGMAWIGGLINHGRGATIFSTPTINGYKRYRSYSLAPDRLIWGRDNRGVMLRVLGGPGDPTSHVENRVGEPTANPYLYFASQIAAGLDGLERGLDPGPSADVPYETEAPALPKSLPEAIEALRQDRILMQAMGQGFCDYFLRIKEAELARFWSEVTDWEQREYFELF